MQLPSPRGKISGFHTTGLCSHHISLPGCKGSPVSAHNWDTLTSLPRLCSDAGLLLRGCPPHPAWPGAPRQTPFNLGSHRPSLQGPSTPGDPRPGLVCPAQPEMTPFSPGDPPWFGAPGSALRCLRACPDAAPTWASGLPRPRPSSFCIHTAVQGGKRKTGAFHVLKETFRAFNSRFHAEK